MSLPTLAEDERDAYLDRLDLTIAEVTVDRAGLERLQRAHMTTVAFENLDVVAGAEMSVDPLDAVRKIASGRGGWCFELNGAFAVLLNTIGFDVLPLGAAVLLGGPNVVIDHLTLEVDVDEPLLVDVGFGESFLVPLPLNRDEPQDGGIGSFQFLASPQGTTLARLDDGVPVAQYRFKRVRHDLADFAEASTRLASDPDLDWSTKPFATRLLDGGPDRVTLTIDTLKVARGGSIDSVEVAPGDWSARLLEWFGIDEQRDRVVPDGDRR